MIRTPRSTLADFQSLQSMMLAELLRCVEIESPTTVKPAVDTFSEWVAKSFADIEMSLEWKQEIQRGNHLIARWGEQQNKVLLIGHLDTVWEPGIFEQMPIRVEDDLAYGPGIFDMKGGIVVALFALRMMKEQGEQNRNITLLLVSDEEEGSESSRQLIEAEAKDARCALILEPGGPNNGLKTKRRGVGRFTITAHGKAAHAGVEPEKGISAIEEIAHQILEIQSWNRLRSGISVNIGLVRGGTRTNVIPAEAEAIVDARCEMMGDVTWLEDRFRNLTSHNPDAPIEVMGGIERPPLERTEKVLALYAQAKEIADSFDYPVTEFWTGGGSDGNFTAAMGIPTLDGLGVEGDGAHALHEHIIVSSLPKRANLLYHLILKLA
jgi:glutamate carboxypeptidase